MRILQIIFCFFTILGVNAQTTTGSISGIIFNDLDGDGFMDVGEPAISGVTVFLDLNTNGVFDGGESVTISGGTGFNFISLAPSTYSVNLDVSTLPSGFVLTTGNIPQEVVLGSGQTIGNLSFGFQQRNASISGFVWNDLDESGIFEFGEPGLSGITVFLDINENGSMDMGEPMTNTLIDGSYSFSGLATGNYQVNIDLSTVPSEFILTGGALPTLVSLAAGEMENSINFGFVSPTIPTLSQWGIIILSLLTVIGGVIKLRARLSTCRLGA